MFDLVRKHTRMLMFMLFLLIIPAFVLVGVDGYTRFNEGGETVARVAGKDITKAEWDYAHKNDTDRIRASVPSIDAKLLDSAQARYATLERLVRERVLVAAADKDHLTTSDTRLARDLQANPSIAALRGADGSLDMERYRLLVASQGLTPEGFEARVRRDLSMRQVEAGVVSSGFTPAPFADVSLGAFFEKREVQVTYFPAADFAAKVTLTDAEIEAFYRASQARFQAPETINVEYLVLDLESIKKSITINEADLKTYYEQNAARLAGPEERRASHILINAAKDAPAADRAKAKLRAQELLAEVRKAPDQFADLARKNSQDQGSASAGGDLDFFARGAMVKPFEDAAFALKKGDVSEVVESDFGYHIIRLTDIKTPKQRSFDEMRASLETELKTQQAQRKYAESAEAFTNAVYEQPESLKPASERLKLEVKTASGLTRAAAAGSSGILANAKFLAALFSDDAIQRKRNTEALETAPNQLVAGRVVVHTPARTLPLAEVRAAVRDGLTNVRAAELARKDGLSLLAAWKGAPAQITVAPVVVSRDELQNLPGKVVDAVLRADPTALPVVSGVDLAELGYAVVKVNKVVGRAAPDEAAARQARGQYAQVWAAAESGAYYTMLKDRFKVKINVPRPTAATGEKAAGS